MVARELPEVTIGGQPGRVRTERPEEVEASVVAGRRVYVLTLLHEGPEARGVLDAFVADLELRPDDAVVASPGPSH